MTTSDDRRQALPVLLGLLVVLLLAMTAFAGDWPHWRGPNRNGHVDESSGWNGKTWVGDPAWQTNVGEGSTTPVVVDDRLYTAGHRDGRDVVVCLDTANGRTLWSQDYESPRYGRLSTGDKGVYAAICSTPEYDPATRLLYTLGIDGDLHCWDTANAGRPVWNRNLYDDYEVPRRPRVGRSGQRDYGYTSSPLVHADWLLVEVGSTNGNLIAFDKKTGKEVWRSENTDPPGHTGGPVPFEIAGPKGPVPAVAVQTFEGLLVVRLDGPNRGRTVGTFPWKTDFANAIPTPAVHGSSVLITSAYNHKRIARIDVSLDGLKERWRVRPGANVCSPVVVDGCVLNVQGRMHCIDFETGEPKWEGGRYGAPASIVATNDGRLVTWANRGDLVLIEGPGRSPDQYTELARIDRVFKRDAWPHVVLAHGRLYGKDRDGNLACWTLPR